MIKRLKNRINKLTKKEKVFIIVLLAFSMVFLALSIYLYINDKNNVQNELNNTQNQEILNTSYYTIDNEGNVVDTWNQLCNGDNISLVGSGVTITALNGVWTLNGVGNGNYIKTFGSPVYNHYMLIDIVYLDTPTIYLHQDGKGDFTTRTIYKHTSSNTNAYYINWSNGSLVSCDFSLMIIDLTSMYGSGNEPITYAQFISDNPRFNEYVAYTNGHNTSVTYYSQDNYDDYGFNRFNDGVTYADGRVNTDSVSYDEGYNRGYTEGTSDANNTIVIGNASYNAGIGFADGRVNTDSASYHAGESAGIGFADGRVNTDSASYHAGESAGIGFADGRVNTDSASYHAGESAGIGFADGRVNTDSASYHAGENAGYADGYNVGVSTAQTDSYNEGYVKGASDTELKYFYFDNKTLKVYTAQTENETLIGSVVLSQDTYTNFIIDVTDLIEDYGQYETISFYRGDIDLNILSSDFYCNAIYSTSDIEGYFTIYYADGTIYNVPTYDLNREYHIYDGSITNPNKIITSISFAFHYDKLLTIELSCSPSAINYTNGYNKGYDKGYTSGKVEGNTIGYNSGYLVGYNEGASTDITTNGMKTLFNSILSYPINMLQSVFNFNFMGINIASFIMFLVSLGIVAFVLKKFLK